MHRSNLLLYSVVVLALFNLLVPLSSNAKAQGPVTWSEPFNISDSPTSSVHPAVVADVYGHVHVFWCEDVGGRHIPLDETPDAPNAISYRRWDGQTWTDPVDIIAVADDRLADFVAAAVDDDNQLHLVWTGLTRLYYSSARATEAELIRAWSEPYVVSSDSARSQWESDVAVDAQGNVHIAYATRGGQTAVFHTMRTADGSWTLPSRVSDYLRDNEVAFKDVRLLIDESDRIHAAWSTANTNGFSQAVYYARSSRLGRTWEPPVMLADATIDTGFTGFPSMLAHGPDELLLIHGDEGNKGRIERTSDDGGASWSDPRFILSPMEGVNGFLIPLVDGGDTLHLVINMRPSADQRTGIYYAPRAGSDWAPIAPVAVEAPYGPTAHYTDAAVRLGNEIHVVWTQLRGGEIWHVCGTIEGIARQAPAIAPTMTQPLPTPTHLPPVDAETGTVDAPALPLAEAASPAVDYRAAWQPIAWGIAPAVLLVLGAAAWALLRR